MGAGADVGLAAGADLTLLLPVLGDAPLSAHMTYTSPMPAPVAQGDVLGELIVRLGEGDGDGSVEHRIPLLATASVAQGGLSIRLTTALRAVLDQVMAPPPDPADG